MLSADASTEAPHQNLGDLVEVLKFLLFLFSLGSPLKDSVPIVLYFTFSIQVTDFQAYGFRGRTSSILPS